MSSFKQHQNLNLSEVNQDVLKAWDEQDLFHRSMTEREGCPSFVFFEGPPSANGHPGIHHVMARSLKDAFCRYKTMKGFQVKRKAGWDTHGLPVELGVEKELNITKEDIGKNISIADYNAHCRRNVMKYTQEWTELSRQMGYWVDMENPYITYDNSYIESVWWLLGQLYEKGLLYKGYTIQPYSPAAGTGLSSHELNQPGCYRDVKDTTVTAQFRIVNPKPEMQGWGDAFFLAWTTTPWTLPSNTALCVGPSIDYVALRTFNPYTGQPMTAVMASVLVNSYFNKEGENADFEAYKQGDKVVPYQIVGSWKGSELVGMNYEPLMPWVKPCEKLSDQSSAETVRFAEAHPEKCFSVGDDRFVELAEAAFRVIPGDYVTTEDGTGIVHIAPTFGADDAKVAKAAGIPSLFLVNQAGETRPMVDLTGKYYLIEELAPSFLETCVDKELYAHHAGAFVKNAYAPEFNQGGKYDEKAAQKAEDLNIILCMELKQEGKAFKIEKHVHNYPHCWRTDKPVLYYPLDSWFIRSSALKERMMELNEQIQWKPASTGTGRFGKWLENLNDWNLSRSRYWGTPLPIWRNADTKEEMCISSLEQLYAEIEKSVQSGFMKSNPLKEKGFVPGDYSRENYDRIDLHRPYVDEIVLVSPSGAPMRREADLIDVWFDSGSMPYAQLHYPFENKEEFDKGNLFPADFIAEGVDQTRGWFFTLHAIATMVFDQVSFKTVISNGLVLDKNGNKMSKRLGNAVDPFEVIAEHGSDAVRWYMLTNSSPWDNLKFDVDRVRKVSRSFFGKLFQTYSFFSMYANIDGFDPKAPAVPMEERSSLDRWILSELNSLILDVTRDFDEYEPTRAGRRIQNFVTVHLSNWFVRLSRKRIWGTGLTTDKLSAYQTLYTCLLEVSRLMAPIAPFYADRLYLDLTAENHRADSVHLDSFPVADETLIDKDAERRMELAQRVSSMVLSLRKKERIIVRQPLRCVAVPITEPRLKEDLECYQHIILEEVNVKELHFADANMLEKKVMCNFPVMGAKFGKLMNSVNAAVTALSTDEINQLERDSRLSVTLADGEVVEIERGDVKIITSEMPGWAFVTDGNLTVALDLTVTPELKNEGVSREIVKRIQNHRKESGFEITDRIRVTLSNHPEIEEAVNSFHDYIAAQVLADELRCAEIPAGTDGAVTFDFGDFTIEAVIER